MFLRFHTEGLHFFFGEGAARDRVGCRDQVVELNRLYLLQESKSIIDEFCFCLTAIIDDFIDNCFDFLTAIMDFCFCLSTGMYSQRWRRRSWKEHGSESRKEKQRVREKEEERKKEREAGGGLAARSKPHWRDRERKRQR